MSSTWFQRFLIFQFSTQSQSPVWRKSLIDPAFHFRLRPWGSVVMRHLLRIRQGLSSYKTQAQESLFPHFLTFCSTSVRQYRTTYRTIRRTIRRIPAKAGWFVFTGRIQRRAKNNFFATFDSKPKFVHLCLSLCLPLVHSFFFPCNL